MTNNNLTLSIEDFKGTNIEKGILRDAFEKSEFTDKPKKAEEEEPKQPSVEEVHENEAKAMELKKEATAKNDKAISYDALKKDEKRAIRVLLNIEGKSSKEKIEAIIEHFGVSKLGAINILTDASKEMNKEGEKEGKNEKKEKDASKEND